MLGPVSHGGGAGDGPGQTGPNGLHGIVVRVHPHDTGISSEPGQLPAGKGAGAPDGRLQRVEGDTIELRVDVLGSCFFMLTRLEERLVATRDAYGRFPATASVAHAEGFLDSMALESGRTLPTHALPGDAADAILQVAGEVNADLIVVGNKGMAGARRFLLGSVPNKVSHHAPCSVIIIRTT